MYETNINKGIALKTKELEYTRLQFGYDSILVRNLVYATMGCIYIEGFWTKRR
jgi:hypothetical protein